MGRAIILKGLLISCLALINITWAADNKPAEAKTAESKTENTETKSDKVAKADDAKVAEGKGDKSIEAKSAEKKPDEANKEAITLNDNVSAELKAAIEAADKANKASAKVGFEWFWSDKSGTEHVQEAITLANAGEDKKAMQVAKLVELAGKQGLEQAEKSKKAKPDF